MNLIFYDGDCPLCNRVVRFLLQRDKKRIFYFAPLSGKTAESELKLFEDKDPDLDTLIFLQDYQTSQQKILIRGKAALRILWILGGPYKLIGVLSFLPSVLFDLVYRVIAHYRYQIFNGKFKKITTQEMEGRFLQ